MQRPRLLCAHRRLVAATEVTQMFRQSAQNTLKRPILTY